jgi:hypothetical protein
VVMKFHEESLEEILPRIQERLEKRKLVTFWVVDPDVARAYSGSVIVHEGRRYRYRGYRAWVGLAEILHARMCTPIKKTNPWVEITFEALQEGSFHHDERSEEKYGISSHFAKIQKMEEPTFLHYYQEALSAVGVERCDRILDLGINRADEFAPIVSMVSEQRVEKMEFVGVDHASSAIDEAKRRFDGGNFHFFAHDINDLDALALGRFDLLISIGTLQSRGIAFKEVLMRLVRNYLTKRGAIILGFPNSRWIDGEMIYGAKVPHYASSEMGVVLSDIVFAKKYLQQKRYRVAIAGREYLFLRATKIGD